MVAFYIIIIIATVYLSGNTSPYGGEFIVGGCVLMLKASGENSYIIII